MGGCASTPKEVALNEGEAPPVEIPTTPKSVEGETVVAQESGQEGGEKKEEPLIDLFEAKEEKVEAKAEEAEVVPAETTEEPVKEEEKAEQPKAEEKSEEPLVTV